jgi:hypothetical protein
MLWRGKSEDPSGGTGECITKELNSREDLTQKRGRRNRNKKEEKRCYLLKLVACFYVLASYGKRYTVIRLLAY